jgi:fused signal recognition particle receptor
VGLKDLFSFSLGDKLGRLFAAGGDRRQTLDELEEILIGADVPLTLAARLRAALEKRGRGGDGRAEFLVQLRAELLDLLAPAQETPLNLPEKAVWLLVGVNGSGKTTSAAKLAAHFSGRGRRVMLAAADTFRAAGSTQLALWGERLGVPVVGGERGADPGSVVFNALNSFAGREQDLLLIDTAGRMQSRDGLMKELEKIVRIVRRFDPSWPNETLLVLDAANGQNALVQAEKFRDFSGVSGLVLAKMDGTARGGTIVGISDSLKVPVRWVGCGEGPGDLAGFSIPDFVDALLG